MTDARLVLAASGLLREFNEAGVLAPADVHVARRLSELAGEDDEAVQLAAALAVRGPRLGHVCVDLATIRDTATVDVEEPVDLSALPWPEPDELAGARGASALIGPLQLEGSVLYLDRYWREERRVAADLLALMEAPPTPVDEARLEAGLERMRARPTPAARRRDRGAAALRGRGRRPGHRQDDDRRAHPRAAVRAGRPAGGARGADGEAAARLVEAVREEASGLDVTDQVREQLLAVEAVTLHRLLGWRPGSHSRFRHDRHNHLPHDVIVIDETSMVPLERMARLLEAVRPGARLILVGDPGQLASIEAGAVLGDIVGPADTGPIVVLDKVHRYGGAIAEVAEAIRRGDADAVVDALDGVTWIPEDAPLDVVRERAVESNKAVLAAARAGDGATAIKALGAFRVLCAHRRGPYGVSAWTARIEEWIGNEAGGDWYVGRPLLVTENDYGLRLFNGDTGVVIASGQGRVSAAFERHGEVVEFSPTRLSAVDTVYAMTVHKSQGSQFDTAAVLLPEPTSRDPHPRAALHGGHARARGADPGRERGVRPGGGGAADRPRVRAAPAALGRAIVTV